MKTWDRLEGLKVAEQWLIDSDPRWKLNRTLSLPSSGISLTPCQTFFVPRAHEKYSTKEARQVGREGRETDTEQLWEGRAILRSHIPLTFPSQSWNSQRTKDGIN